LGLGAAALAISQPMLPENASSQPASMPSQDRCRQQADDLLKRLDSNFLGLVEPPFVVVGNCSAEQLAEYAVADILQPAQIMWRTYFQTRPEEVILVLLFQDDASYLRGAKNLFGDSDVSRFGYYRPESRALVINTATGAGTLVHELTHALMACDFPDAPRWLQEGLASLHEQCCIREDRIIGLPNWRLKELQRAIQEKKLRPLSDLLTRDDFYGPLRGLNYAQARYLCMYMQEKGLLQKFYLEFRQNHEGEKAAVTALEKVFDSKFDQIEAGFLTWAASLKAQPEQ
jgi:hypothetical protein